MNIYKSLNRKAVSLIKQGGIGVIPTDTLYGLVASAANKTAVEKLYLIKKRTPQKPFIILISDISDIQIFGILLDISQKKLLEVYWPGQNSLILPCHNEDFIYLSRNTGTLAFRLPDNSELRDILKKTGPLVAPSANPEGKDPANDILEAIKYFGNDVDFYVDGGALNNTPSKLFDLTSEKPIRLR